MVVNGCSGIDNQNKIDEMKIPVNNVNQHAQITFVKKERAYGMPRKYPMKRPRTKLLQRPRKRIIKRPWEKPKRLRENLKKMPRLSKLQPPKQRLRFNTNKVKRIASAVSETVDAVFALIVPGHEAAMNRRKDDRIPLDRSLIAFSVASGIVAAILSI